MRTHPQRPGQRGLALITAVLVVAIVATIAASLALGTQIWIRQAQNAADRAQGVKVAQAAMQFAMHVLADDAKRNAARDDLGEDWATQQLVTEAEEGMVAGAIEDAQGRFNLNNLIQNGQPSAPDLALFQRLLVNVLGTDPGVSDAVLDWMDADGELRPAGAEDLNYLGLRPPYRAANRRFESVDELRLVRGCTPELVARLRPFLSALPQPTTVNINTAPREVLLSLFLDLPASMADRLIEDRKKEPFADTGQLATRSGFKPAEGVAIGVVSSYFIVHVETRFGRLTRTLSALVAREANAQPRLLWQAYAG